MPKRAPEAAHRVHFGNTTHDGPFLRRGREAEGDGQELQCAVDELDDEVAADPEGEAGNYSEEQLFGADRIVRAMVGEEEAGEDGDLGVGEMDGVEFGLALLDQDVGDEVADGQDEEFASEEGSAGGDVGGVASGVGRRFGCLVGGVDVAG